MLVGIYYILSRFRRNKHAISQNIQYQFDEDVKRAYRMTICYSLWILLIKANKNMCALIVHDWRLVYRKLHFQWHLIVLHSIHNDRFYEHFTKIPYVDVRVLFIKTTDIYLLVAFRCVNVSFIYRDFEDQLYSCFFRVI